MKTSATAVVLSLLTASAAMAQTAELKNRAAVEAVINHEITVGQGAAAYTYLFLPSDHVEITIGGKKHIGLYGDADPEKPGMCMAVGNVPPACFTMSLVGNQFSVKDKNNKISTGSVGPAKGAVSSPPPLHAKMCELFKTVVDTHQNKGDFASLTDPRKPTFKAGITMQETFFATIGISEEMCMVPDGSKLDHIRCRILFSDNDPKADSNYDYFVSQFQQCMAPRITSKTLDYNIYQKVEMPKLIFLPLIKRSAQFHVGKKANSLGIEIALRAAEVCDGQGHCKIKDGIVFSALGSQ